MASSTIAMNNSSSLEDIMPRGVHRSRLSVHVNTPRVRRWLLVQLVSIPMDQSEESQNARAAQRQSTEEPATMQRLLNNYQMNRLSLRAI